MRARITLKRYCTAVIAAGAAVVTAFADTTHFTVTRIPPFAFACLATGVFLGEMLPVKIPRRGSDEEITLATSFSLALLLAGGFAPAFLAQAFASISQDALARKPLWRILFNVGQYALSLAAAMIVMRMLSAASRIGSSHPFTSAELPAVLLGAAAFFAVNTTIVGVAVALYQRMPIGLYFRRGVSFVVMTWSVLLFLAPIVVAAAAYSPFLLPLFAAPMLAIYLAAKQAAQSEHASRHDALTGLPNRAAFHATVSEALAELNGGACVLLMDLDRFKEVNDTLGHHYGDLLLGQVAERLRAQLGADDQIARLGGDEFAVFSPRRAPAESLALAHRIAESLRTPFELEQIVVDVQGSVGAALYPDDGTDVETLLQKADVAMYRAKETHADVARYEEHYDHHSPAKLALTADLRTAVQGEEIVVWYQPVLALADEEVFATEALVRWEHPDLGLLPPWSFINMAEHTNLIKPLTHRVLAIALAQAADWAALGLELTLAVNVSTRVLVDEGFTQHVLVALDRAGVAPSRLKLEITESTLMADPLVARRVLRELHRMGIEISIDDFGTGYSSLAYLADLPVSEVKIDRSFVTRMAGESRETIIVSSIIDLAHHLGLRAVAEGVEDVTVLRQLRELGCDAVQGYGISRPMAGEDATHWLLNRLDGSRESAPANSWSSPLTGG
jgi:diguanylate cyclase (GGDEF)-like protein